MTVSRFIQDCDTTTCGGMCAAAATECLNCAGATDNVLLEDLTCDPGCNGVLFEVDGVSYCRQDDIYVNPESMSPIALGTKEHPYRYLHEAFIEVWNYHTEKTDPIKIYLMEETTSKVWYRDYPLLLYGMEDFVVDSYTERIDEDTFEPLPANRANMHVTNNEEFSQNNKFSVMKDVAYDFTIHEDATID